MVPLSPGRERAILLVLAAVQFTHVIDFMIMMPLGPQLMDSLGIGTGAFAHLVASYGLSAGVSGVLATFVMDRFDRKRALVVLFAGFCGATFACAMARDYSVLLFARVLAGAFGGVAGSVVSAMIGDVVPPERRGRGMAFVMSAFSLAQIVGVPAGLWLAAERGWSAPFAALAGLGVVVLGVALVVLPRVDAHVAQRHGQSDWARVREIATNTNHLRAFAVVALITLSGMVMVPFLATALVRNGGMAPGALWIVYTCGGLATLVSNNWLGQLGDRVGHVPVFFGTVLFAIVPVVAVAHLAPWPLPLVLVATTAFIISMGGRWTPSMALVTMSVEGRLRGGFMSLNSAIQAGFGAVGASLAGIIVTEAADGHIVGYGWAGAASLVFLAGAAWLIRRLRVVDTQATARPPAPETGVLD